MPRSSNGLGSRFFNPQTGVRFPYGVLAKHESERGEAWLSRLVGGQEIVGSNPTVLTDRRLWAQVQMGARLLWEQKVSGSTPECPTRSGSRGLVAQIRLITGLR